MATLDKPICSNRDESLISVKQSTCVASHEDLINSNVDNTKLTTELDPLTAGSKSPIQTKDPEITKPGHLPTHLQPLPPAIPIPDGYNWVFIHGGWTLIPSINSEKFYNLDPSPQDDISDDLNDVDLVDWEDGDKYIDDEIVEYDHLSNDVNSSHMETDIYSPTCSD